MDLAKYRTIFVEESTENFAEISSALLELEKDPSSTESIDVVFRMAHSIKGMAASLGYDGITEVAHRLEDRMQIVREAGRMPPGDEATLLFRGLAALEGMVTAVREGRDSPPADPELVEALSQPLSVAAAAPEPVENAEKKASEQDPRPQPASAAALESPRPPASVRVHTRVLDRFLSTVGEVILNTSQVRTAAEGRDATQGPSLAEGLDRMERIVGELERRALELRTTQLRRIVEPLPRTAREIAQRAGKKVEVEIIGAELELDRSILDRLSDPLVHLLRNAVDHGVEAPDARIAAGKPETGRIAIEARREKDSIRIAIADDGRGLDLEALRSRAVKAGIVHADLAEDLPPDEVAALVFHPGLSTKEEVSEISGRGVGMDAVRVTIESLGGSIELESQPGRGTTTTLHVPITAAVQRVLLLGLGDEIVALPISKVERIVELPAEKIERSGDEAFVLIGEELVPVLDLARFIALAPPAPNEMANLVLIDLRGERVALVAERVAGQQQIYVKPVPSLLDGVRALSGLTILGDGRPMFLLDPNQLA